MISVFRKKVASIKNGKVYNAINPVIAIFLAFSLAGLVVLICGENPLEAYAALAKGALGSKTGLENTIRYMLPILFLAISFSICDRAGYFNIGQEGQVNAAGLAIIAIQVLLPTLPDFPLLIIMILASVLAAAIIALIPAVLKFLLGINEVVTAVLINYIMLLFSNYMLIYSPLADKGLTVPTSIPVAPVLSDAVIITVSVVVVGVYAIVLHKTTAGFKLRMIGYNIRFAKASGLHVLKTILIATAVGGALAGLTSAGEVMGVYHKMYYNYMADIGFSAVTAALIGRHSVIGMIFGSFVLGALTSGAVTLQIMTDVSTDVIQVIKGFVMIFATISILRSFINKNRKAESA